ncbi:hypothetical protein PG996_010297 [Apiospora saccharicola]|uniref:Uncharacterized protein n=1 Tax=Apiospora saccharicola TaxID=335842 RepID=A0ABR1UNU3_9PEZI
MCHTPDVLTCTERVHGDNRDAEPADAPIDAVQKLEQLLGDHFIPVTHADFSTKLTQRWSTWQAPSYIGAVQPTTEEDVAKIARTPSRRCCTVPLAAINGPTGPALRATQDPIPRHGGRPRAGRRVSAWWA